MYGDKSMICWTKDPPVNVGKVEHYRNLQNEIRAGMSVAWSDNIVCKCSGDCVPILIFFENFNRESVSKITGEFTFGYDGCIKYIITPELTKQIDWYVDNIFIDSIKII